MTPRNSNVKFILFYTNCTVDNDDTEWWTTHLTAQNMDDALSEAKRVIHGTPEESAYTDYEHGEFSWSGGSLTDDVDDIYGAYVVDVENWLPVGSWNDERDRWTVDMEERHENMSDEQRAELMEKAEYEKAKAQYERLRDRFEPDASVSPKSRKKKVA